MKTNSSIWLLIIATTVLGCAANLKRPSIQERPLVTGDRLRVSHSNGASKVGNLVALSADTLFLRDKKNTPTVGLLLASINKVELSREKSSNAGAGFLMGAVLGVLVGSVVGNEADKNAEEDCLRRFPDDSECEIQFRGLVGGVLGGLVGGVAGGSGGSEKWEEVPVEKVKQSSAK